nr:S46 family peptidase [Terriglobales bacterium]
DQRQKPNDQRLREFRESALSSLEQRLFSTAPIYKNLETVKLTTSLTQMNDDLSSDTSAAGLVMEGRDPAVVAKELINGTKLDDVNVRKQLWEGGAAAIQASTDPLIVAMRKIEPEALAARKRYDDNVDAVERQEGAKIARAQFSKSGFTQPPDAGFTLRLSYGAVKGYNENGKKIPWATNMGGAFDHAAAHGNKPPYELPASWTSNKAKLNLKTPFNYVSTADIIGGNSGSPTVNKEGEVVGIIFDGNIQSLPWDFVFDEREGRAVSVDSRAIQEALRKIYNAAPLADELMKGSMAGEAGMGAAAGAKGSKGGGH